MTETNAKWDPTDVEFEEWLVLKFANHMMMDPFTKKVLWDFWKNSDNQEKVIDNGFSNLEEANNNKEQEIGEIFRIETNLFDYETPLCAEFNEFNYLLKVDPELFTYDIERTINYEDYDKLVIISANLFVSKMGKLNSPPAVQMRMDSITVENYQEWFELVI
ncbi:hypothetical protein Tco_0661468 [Tanacetum coccineum]